MKIHPPTYLRLMVHGALWGAIAIISSMPHSQLSTWLPLACIGFLAPWLAFGLARGRIKIRLGCFVAATVLLLGVVWHALRHLAFGINPQALLVAQSVLFSASIVMLIIVPVLVCVNRYKHLVFFELALAFAFFSRSVVGHRASYARPQWLADLAAEYGWSTAETLQHVGVLMLWGILAALLFVRSCYVTGGNERLRRFVARALLVGLLVSGLGYFAPRMPQLPIVPPVLVPPPAMSANEPPPPPPPEPLLLVEFEHAYQPTRNLGAYYFREQCMSGVSSTGVVAFAGIDYHDDAAFIRDDMLHAMFTNRQQRVSYKTSYLNNPEQTAALINPVSLTRVDPRDSRFAASFQGQSIPPGHADADFSDQLRRRLLRNPEWPEGWLHTLVTNEELAGILELVAVITSELDEMFHSSEVHVALEIQKWINNTIAYSSEASQANTNSILEIMLDTRVGGALEFSHLAVLLLRHAGIPARVAAGFRYAIAPKEKKLTLVLADSHRTFWPEIYIEGTGWNPFALNPTNVLDRASPQPEIELEKELARPPRESLSKDGEDSIVGVRRLRWWQAVLVGIVLLVALALRGPLLLLYPYIAPERRLPYAVMRAIEYRLWLRGFQRKCGQFRSEFAAETELAAFVHLTNKYAQLPLATKGSKHDRAEWLKDMRQALCGIRQMPVSGKKPRWFRRVFGHADNKR